MIKKVIMNQVVALVIPTDKFSDWLFEQTKPVCSKKMDEGKFKGKTISSTIELKCKGGLLSQFDKAVLLALISEYQAGNQYVSVQRLFETLGGSNHLNQKMKETLLKSVRKLMETYIKIDMTELVNKYPRYTGKKKIIEGALLPCTMETIEINGKITESTIHLLGDALLFQVANIKNQIARLPSIFLSKIYAAENLIALNWFLLERVTEIIGSNSEKRKERVRKLNTTISFDTLCQKCGFGEFNKIQKSRLREKIKIILEQFKKSGLIDAFNFVIKNGKFTSIELFLNEKSA